MVHRGEIIKKIVHESGYSITTLAKRLNKSRRWVYYIFEKPNVSLDVVLQIGKILHHDFSLEMKGVTLYSMQNQEAQTVADRRAFNSEKEEIQHWKEQYYSLLEKYNDLLERN
ncbi:MAG: putative transcriptional regulator [Crocinitomicaceae bacterium]|jgi:predicted transcriptional regulator